MVEIFDGEFAHQIEGNGTTTWVLQPNLAWKKHLPGPFELPLLVAQSPSIDEIADRMQDIREEMGSDNSCLCGTEWASKEIDGVRMYGLRFWMILTTDPDSVYDIWEEGPDLPNYMPSIRLGHRIRREAKRKFQLV